jgi:hypothetical protein
MRAQIRAGERKFISTSRKLKFAHDQFFHIPDTVLAGTQAEKAT